MIRKEIGLGMLIVMLVFGMSIVGCKDEPEPEQEPNNKFYGTWVQASTVSDVSSLSAAAQAAGMGESSSGIIHIKDGDQWYKQDLSLLWYYFENSTYTFSTTSSGTRSAAVSYTFTETQITAGGETKSYTFTTKQSGGDRVDILKWDGKILLKRTMIL